MLILKWTLMILLCYSTAMAFPLKSKQKGETLPWNQFEILNDIGQVDANHRIILLWRSDKRTSKVTLKSFAKVCKDKKLPCMAVEMKSAPLEKMLALVSSPPDHFAFAHDSNGITKDWGIFTLPVTIVLNKQNAIVDAFGYEGQYEVKLARFIDLQQGVISQDSYDKVTNVKSVNRKSCKIASLNFIDRLIRSGQTDDAKKKLKRISPTDLRPEGKLKYAEIHLKLKLPETVIPMLQEMAKQNIGAQFYLAYAYFQQEKYEDALTLLDKIKTIFPEKQKMNYLIGHIYHAKGDYKNAAFYYAKSCNSDLF